MGDIISGIFGGGGKTTQTTTPDATSQALNTLRLQELSSIFSGTPSSTFAGPQSDLFTVSPQTQRLIDYATNIDNGSLLNIKDYLNLGLDQSKGFISQVATPQILSTAALQGLESGGFVPESIAKATSQIALPFLQSLPSATQGFASGAQQLLQLSDYPRALREEDFLRRQGFITSGLTGIPFSPGSTTKGRQSSQPLFNFFGQG